MLGQEYGLLFHASILYMIQIGDSFTRFTELVLSFHSLGTHIMNQPSSFVMGVSLSDEEDAKFQTNVNADSALICGCCMHVAMRLFFKHLIYSQDLVNDSKICFC